MNRIAISTVALVAKPPWRGRYAAVTRESPQRGVRCGFSCLYSLALLARRSTLARGLVAPGAPS